MKGGVCRSTVCHGRREHDCLSPVQCQTIHDHDDVLWRRCTKRVTFHDITLPAFTTGPGRAATTYTTFRRPVGEEVKHMSGRRRVCARVFHSENRFG